MLSLLLFFCSDSLNFSLTWESNSLSDYRRVRLPPSSRVFSYIVLTEPLYLSGWNSWFQHFLLLDPVSGTFAGFRFSPILLRGSSGIAVSCNVQFSQYVRFHISTCGVFSFFVSYAYFVPGCSVFVLPSFIHAESVYEFASLACCYSRWFFLGMCYYKLLHFHPWAIVCLCFRYCF